MQENSSLARERVGSGDETNYPTPSARHLLFQRILDNSGNITTN